MGRGKSYLPRTHDMQPEDLAIDVSSRTELQCIQDMRARCVGHFTSPASASPSMSRSDVVLCLCSPCH